MLTDVPDRNTWTKVKVRPGSKYSTRAKWCDENCTQRWIASPGDRITEFENKSDAAMFMLWWG